MESSVGMLSVYCTKTETLKNQKTHFHQQTWKAFELSRLNNKM
jgi:hypothetical protein